MAVTNKTNTRPPSRTPPFVLVGLLVIVAFLSYSYWSLRSDNAELSARLDNLQIEKRDNDVLFVASEKNLAQHKIKVQEYEHNVAQLKKDLESKTNELASVVADLNSRKTNAEQAQNQLNECNTKLAELNKSTDGLKADKEELEKQLQSEKAKTPTCDLAFCNGPIKDILQVTAKLTGSDALIKALTDAKLEAVSLMKEIQFPPVAQQPSEKNSEQGTIEKQNSPNPSQAKEQSDPGKAA